jgi:hypothetical protein
VPTSPEDVVALLFGERAPGLVDLEKPIDLAATSDSWAVSLAVSSLDAARTALPPRLKLMPADNGALWIDGLSGPGDHGTGRHARACELAPAAGDSPWRLVCASNPGALSDLAPFLTRTASRRAVSTDVHVEQRMDRAQAGGLRTTIPDFVGGTLHIHSSEPAWVDLLDAFAGEMSGLEMDVDRVTLDGKLEDGAVQLELKTTFRSAAAQTTRILAGHPERIDTPPGSFWRLPRDSDVALFERGIDTERIAGARDRVLRLVSSGFEKGDLDAADRDALTAALGKLVTSPAPAVFARGVDLPVVVRDLRAAQDGKDVARELARRSAGAQAAGWWMAGLDEPAARVQAAMKELAAAWNRPGTQAWVKAQGDKDAPTLAIAATEPSLGLPAGTTHLLLTVPAPRWPPPPKGAPPWPPYRFHTFAIPDHGQVWLVAGLDAGVLAARMRDVLSGAPARTLAGRSELEGLKTTQATFGVFVTPRGLWTGNPGLWVDFAASEASTTYARVEALGDRAMAPTVLTASSFAPTRDTPGGGFVVTLRIAKSAVDAMLPPATTAAPGP